MASNRKKKQSSRTSLKEFVTVAFAEDMELAKDYKKLLNDENIPVAIKDQPDSSSAFRGIKKSIIPFGFSERIISPKSCDIK